MRRLLILSALLTPLLGSVSLASAQDAGPIEGSWLIGEVDDEDAEAIITFEGLTGTALEIGESEPELFLNYVSSEGPTHVYAATVGDETVEVRFVAQAPNSMLAFTLADDELMQMRRVGPVPAEMQGEWLLVAPPEGRAPYDKVVIEGEYVTVYGPTFGEWRTQLYVLVPDGSVVEMAFAAPTHTEPTLWRTQALDEHHGLVWMVDDDKYAIFHRIGHRPAWLPEAAPIAD